MKSKHSTAFDITMTFITKIFFLSGSFIISILLARLLGPSGKGVVAALFVIPNIMVSLADLGVRQASAYYIGQKKYSLQQVVSSSLILWVISSILSMIIVFVYYVIPQTPNYSWGLVFVAVAYIPVKILVSYFNGILQGQQKISNMNMKFIIEFIIRIIMVVTLVWLFNLDVFGAVLSVLITTIAVLIYSGSIIKQTANLSFKYIKGIPQDMLKKGIIFALALFVLQLNYKIDIVFLENMVSSSDLGIYTVGVTLAELLWQLPTAIAVVLFSRSANSSSDIESSQRSAKLLRLTWIPLIIVSIFFYIGAPLFVNILYGNDFSNAGLVIRILLPGIIVMVLFKILNADIAGRGNPLFALKIYIITLLINIILNMILIPRYGINGAAFSSTISYIVGGVLFSVAYHKYTGVKYKDLFIMNNSDIRMLKEIVGKWKNR